MTFFPRISFISTQVDELLIVPADDAYEGLPTKVIKSFLFMGLACLTVPILKLDDDVICDDVATLKTTLSEVLAKSDYGGRVLPPASRLSDSQFWHFGKCKNPTLIFVPMGCFSFLPMLPVLAIGSAEMQSICFQRLHCFMTGISKPSFMKTEQLVHL